MNLYFIAHYDANDDNRDALIEAETEEEALIIWRKEFEMEPEDEPSIRQVVLTGQARMIPWDDLLQEKPASCQHDWPEADGQTDSYGSCTKCGMSFQRYIHTECP